MQFEQVYVQDPQGRMFGPVSRAEAANRAQENRVHPNSLLIDAASGEMRAARDFPEIGRHFSNSAMSFLVPNNKMALISYYVGIFSILGIFFCGLPALIGGIVAMVAGFKGLKYAKLYPQAKGKAHAITGIVLGTLEALIGGLSVIFLLITLILPFIQS